jgi:hypothetical protein
MSDQSSDSASFLFGKDPDDYPQHILAADLELEVGYLSFYGQALYNVWTYEPNLKSFGYSAEFQYALTPRLNIATRAGGLLFCEVTGQVVPTGDGEVLYTGTWDRNAFRLEGSLTVNITRAALVKLVYEWNHTSNPTDDPHDNMLVIQSVLSF